MNSAKRKFSILIPIVLILFALASCKTNEKLVDQKDSQKTEQRTTESAASQKQATNGQGQTENISEEQKQAIKEYRDNLPDSLKNNGMNQSKPSGAKGKMYQNGSGKVKKEGE